MRLSSRSFLSLAWLAAAAGCGAPLSSTDDLDASGGTDSSGSGATGPASGGGPGSGGWATSGGAGNSGGSFSVGGQSNTGGALGTGGGFLGVGGRFGAGGAAPSGGALNTGGSNFGSGGQGPTGGASNGTGGSGTGGSDPTDIDCNVAMPTTGAAQHSGNGRGGTGNLAWEIWSNMGTGDMVTYPTTAFSAHWNNSGDYLGRIGYEWGNSGKPHAEYGNIYAQFASKKTGSAGGYSYVGIYGWSNDPCVEWYIIDDSFNNMPVNPGNTTNKGEVQLDGGTYILYTRNTSGTGGSRCSGVSNWVQYYSVRKAARSCGVISISEHFNAWDSKGMPLGKLLEAKILVEAGGGQGSVEFPLANVVAEKP